MRALHTACLALGTCALLLTGGCHVLGSCNNPQAYAGAGEIAPLKMPVGLDGPDTSQALAIPPLNQPEAPRGADAPCLEDPPVWKDAPQSATNGAAEKVPEPEGRPRRPAGPPR
jgi:hypothetical protein